jgi:hypothetical protein
MADRHIAQRAAPVLRGMPDFISARTRGGIPAETSASQTPVYSGAPHPS